MHSKQYMRGETEEKWQCCWRSKKTIISVYSSSSQWALSFAGGGGGGGAAGETIRGSSSQISIELRC